MSKPEKKSNEVLSKAFGIDSKSPVLQKLWITRIIVTAVAVSIGLAWAMLK